MGQPASPTLLCLAPSSDFYRHLYASAHMLTLINIYMKVKNNEIFFFY